MDLSIISIMVTRLNTVHLSRNHQLTSMLFGDSEHLENSIKCSWVEQALQNERFLFNRPPPPKMANQFMLHDKENEDIRFCFKASVCELLGDEYLISWLRSARMHVSGTAMHITISPLSHTSLTYCPLHLPHPPTWLMGPGAM